MLFLCGLYGKILLFVFIYIYSMIDWHSGVVEIAWLVNLSRLISGSLRSHFGSSNHFISMDQIWIFEIDLIYFLTATVECVTCR